MATDFLAYWKPNTVDAELGAGGPTGHAASEQFGRVRAGDTVWLVTVRDGRLRLITSITVGHVTGQAGAARLLGVPAASLWESEFHIVAADRTARAIDERDIHDVAPQLRFISAAGKDRLTLGDDGTVNAQQLQTMRVLSPTSVTMLSARI